MVTSARHFRGVLRSHRQPPPDGERLARSAHVLQPFRRRDQPADGRAGRLRARTARAGTADRTRPRMHIPLGRREALVTVPLLRWDGPGSYAVAFSTRLGGVSEAPFDSLNLGRLTEDAPARVAENRSRLCVAAGADPAALAFNRQVHGAAVREADPRASGTPGDGIWTREPGRGLHEAIGPGIGPCCYEVGREVREPFRARFGAGVVRGRYLDLWSATEHALRSAGAARVARSDLCTACNPQLFFSHRRDGARTGRQGALA